MPLCLALFFCRTVFIGYKYLFSFMLVPCVVYSAYKLLKNGITKPNWREIWLPLLVCVLFFARFTSISNVMKESVNLLLIMYFVFFANMYYAEEKAVPLLKWIVRLTVMAGLIAIIKFGFVMLNLHIPLCDRFFEGEGFALVSDCNYYSLFFILAIIISIWLVINRQSNVVLSLSVNLIAFVNISAAMSRRAYILYALLVMSIGVMVILRHAKCKRFFVLNVSLMLTFVMIIFAVLGFSVKLYSPDLSYDQKNRYHKVYSLIDSSTSFLEFDIKQQRNYYKGTPINNNLFYNGDLKSGLKYWRAEHNPPDSIVTTIHNENATQFIRIEKKNSKYGWSLRYMGRPIYYSAGVEYTFSFMYRVVQGQGMPFKVGLWVKENSGYIDDLKKETCPYDSVWNICVVKHVFEKEQLNPTCFLNAQSPNTIIDVKDISLTCADTTGLPRYVDQLPDSVIHKYYSQDTINYFAASRTDRWRYAYELWQTRYDIKQMIFGQGFKYLEWYGEKFWNNPQRYDFPHNPIISSFLYSGIIGGVVYIAFLIMSLWLYWKRRKELGIFFIMYLCCMFFSMFSGSSHFSFPLFAFLSFVPFIEYKNRGETKENACQ